MGVRRPDRGRRRHRPDLHPAGPGPGRGLLVRPAGAGGHLRPGRGVRPGAVGAGDPRRPVQPPHQRAGHLHPAGHRVPVPAPGRAARPAGPRRRRPDQGTAGQAGGPGLARLLRAARRQERDLVPDRQGRRLLPRGVRRDAGQRRPDRRSGGLARRDRPVPGRGGAARLGAGRDGLQRARRRGVVPRGRPDRARTRRRGHRQHGRLQPVRAADAERQADGQPGGQARLRGRGPPGGRHTAGRTRRHHQGRRLLARQPDRARLLDGARPDRHARRRGVRARHRDRGRGRPRRAAARPVGPRRPVPRPDAAGQGRPARAERLPDRGDHQGRLRRSASSASR